MFQKRLRVYRGLGYVRTEARLGLGDAGDGLVVEYNEETLRSLTIDQSGANTAAIENYNTDHHTDIELRQCKYLNNVVEQDHRAIKRSIAMTEKSCPPLISFIPWLSDRTHQRAVSWPPSIIATEPA
jgi:hypothetical protein